MPFNLCVGAFFQLFSIYCLWKCCLWAWFSTNSNFPKPQPPAHRQEYVVAPCHLHFSSVAQSVTYRTSLVPLDLCGPSQADQTASRSELWCSPSSCSHDTSYRTLETKAKSQPQGCCAILWWRAVVLFGLWKGISAEVGGCREESCVLCNHTANMWPRVQANPRGVKGNELQVAAICPFRVANVGISSWARQR